jgi:NAD(P)-dependent dehydrogenase (short-subunit alcohol dehydrogenase family)
MSNQSKQLAGVKTFLAQGDTGDEKCLKNRDVDLLNFHADIEQLFKQMLGGILQGRPQTVDEIASVALFLVSDQASAITGQTLNVDGGMAFY